MGVTTRHIWWPKQRYSGSKQEKLEKNIKAYIGISKSGLEFHISRHTFPCDSYKLQLQKNTYRKSTKSRKGIKIDLEHQDRIFFPIRTNRSRYSLSVLTIFISNTYWIKISKNDNVSKMELVSILGVKKRNNSIPNNWATNIVPKRSPFKISILFDFCLFYVTYTYWKMTKTQRGVYSHIGFKQVKIMWTPETSYQS